MLEITTKGYKEMDLKINKLIKFIKLPRFAFRDAAIAMKRDVDNHFKNSQGPSRKWKRNIAGTPILKDTGKLRAVSLAYDNTSATVGTNVKYAKIHNFGGIIKAKASKFLKFKIAGHFVFVKSVKIPKREFMWLSKKGAERIIDIFELHVKKAVR